MSGVRAGARTGPATEIAATRARAALVRRLVADGALRDPVWRAAFAEVPRHLFVPSYYVATPRGYERRWGEDPDPARWERWLEGVYADEPLLTRLRDGEQIVTSSQPSLMTRMLEALEARDGQKVLEIGAGTGYNAALLCHRLGERRVTTVDLDPAITESAGSHLAAAGYRPAVVTGDGVLGVPSRAPYDRIVATCAVPSVPPAWLAQCRPGGFVLAPLSTGVLGLRVGDAGHAEGRFLRTPAYFMPLRGGDGGGQGATPPPPAGLRGRQADGEALRFLLTLTAGRLDPSEATELWLREGRPGRARFGVTVSGAEQWAWLDDPGGLYAWPLGAGRG
ncbi:methyltransferase domain-containing protein [Streptomyces sp. GC420]|uniref:methyltransferase domain-containing protein n=1 Tax=Streptomyces sp. GC420 TaxID=2697568 RepID=UPI0014151CD0|nr:methyltransferase domain-containing protein [Streptomyces sp. GC420]NBM15573.1 methyltransferase domain-containing protein [Streptomyces sp. GC420]